MPGGPSARHEAAARPIVEGDHQVLRPFVGPVPLDLRGHRVVAAIERRLGQLVETVELVERVHHRLRRHVRRRGLRGGVGARREHRGDSVEHALGIAGRRGVLAQVTHWVVAPVLEHRVGGERVAQNGAAERRLVDALDPDRVEVPVVGRVVIVHDHVGRHVREHAAHFGQRLVELGHLLDLDRMPLSELLLPLLQHTGFERGTFLVGAVLVLGAFFLVDVVGGERIPVLGKLVFGRGRHPPYRRGRSVYIPGLRPFRRQRPAGVAPYHQIQGRELSERIQMAFAIGSGHLRDAQDLGSAAPGRKRHETAGDRRRPARPPAVRMIDRVFRVGRDEVLPVDRHRFERNDLVRLDGLRILVRSDQLVRQRIQHQQLARPDVVGVDLIAAKHELMRALQWILVQRFDAAGGVLERDEIVDHRHRVGVLVRGPAARAVDDAQILQLVRRHRKARQEILDIAEREVRALAPCRAAVRGRHAFQQAERAQRVRVRAVDDGKVVAVGDVRLEDRLRVGGDARQRDGDVQIVGDTQRLRRRIAAEQLARAAFGAAFPQRDGDGSGTAQRDPHRHQLRLNATQDGPCENERKRHQVPPDMHRGQLPQAFSWCCGSSAGNPLCCYFVIVVVTGTAHSIATKLAFSPALGLGLGLPAVRQFAPRPDLLSPARPTERTGCTLAPPTNSPSITRQ